MNQFLISQIDPIKGALCWISCILFFTSSLITTYKDPFGPFKRISMNVFHAILTKGVISGKKGRSTHNIPVSFLLTLVLVSTCREPSNFHIIYTAILFIQIAMHLYPIYHHSNPQPRFSFFLSMNRSLYLNDLHIEYLSKK